MSKPAFSHLFQIGIIVRNLEDAVKYWEENLGMGPWEISPMNAPDLHIDGKPLNGETCAKMAFLHAFGMEIELIEPVAETPYKAWLDEHGPGIHHIAVKPTTLYDELLAQHKEETGKEPWIRGQAMKGVIPVLPPDVYAMDFSYLDLREQAGIIVECYKNLAPGKVGHDYDPENPTPIYD